MAKVNRNPDYVKPGSDQHAMILGLKKAAKDDEPQRDGWALGDVTAFGPAARPEYLCEVLRQKVSTLTSGPAPAPQSEDPFASHYAPPMWTVPEGEVTYG